MKIKKCISGLLVFFFFSNSVFAQVPLSISPAQTFVDLKSPAADIQIPAEFGTVQRNWPAGGPIVIHIADAHAYYEAQIQIKNILDYLVRTYSVRLVGLEGASSTLRPEIFRLFSDKKVNSSVVDSLVKQGELSGAEFLAIQDDSKNAPVWTGVEDKDLYLKDLAAFRSVWNQYETKKGFFEKQKIEIAKLKMRTFSEELRKFDEAENQFADRKLNFIDYGRILQKSASRQLKLDLTNPIHQNNFPNLVRIAILSKIETNVQKQSVQIEKEKSALREKLKGFEWKLEGLNRRYFEEFYGASQKNKVNLNQFPAFKQWAEYEILKSEIEAPALFSEIEVLENKIYDALIRNSEEYSLVNRSQNLRLTEKFTRLEVTREEYEKFKTLDSRVSATADPSFGGRGNDNISELIQEAQHFYELALKREVSLLSNLLKKAREQKLSKVVLVTGGFHTAGIEGILKSEQISHVTITPKIANEDKSGNYLRTILDKIPAPLATGDVAASSRVQRLVGAAKSLGALALGEENDQKRFPSQDTVQGQSLGMVDFSGAQVTPEMIANFAASTVGAEAARLELEGEKSEYPTPEGNLVPRFGYKDSVDGVLSERAAKNREAIKQWTAEQKAKGRKVMLHFGIGGQGMSNSVQNDYWGEDRDNLVIVVDRLGTSMKELFSELNRRGYKPSEIVLDTSSKSGTTDEPLIFYQAAFLELIKRLGEERGQSDDAKALAENFVTFFKKFNEGKDKEQLFANIPEEEFNAVFGPAQRELLKEVFDHLVFTTSKNPKDSRLFALVEGMKKLAPITAFDFSEYTGGRFTENCESALVTDAWRGIDIDSMIKSLEPAAQNYLGEKGNDPDVNLALRAAIVTHLIDPSLILVAVRSPNAISEVLQKVQLFPESNGKNGLGALIVGAVGEAELNAKVQKILNETGKAPLVILVDFPEGKYENLKPLLLNAELAAKVPQIRYVKENISPEANARFALWFQEYVVRYGLMSAAKMAVRNNIQLSISKVGAAGMNQPLIGENPNLFWLYDPQNQPWVEAAKKALVDELKKWGELGRKTDSGRSVNYFDMEGRVKNGPVLEGVNLTKDGKNQSVAEREQAIKTQRMSIDFAVFPLTKLPEVVSDANFLSELRIVRGVKDGIKSRARALFEAVRQNKDEQEIAAIQKSIEILQAEINTIYLKMKNFGKDKPANDQIEEIAKQLAAIKLTVSSPITLRDKTRKTVSPIFYTHLPEVDLLGEFLGFIDSGIGTRDQHANFQHRLDGKDVTFTLLIDVVTPREKVEQLQDKVQTYGLAKDYLDGVYPDEVRRVFLEQEHRALIGELGIDSIDESGKPVKDRRVYHDAAILRISDISTEEGLVSAFRLFSRAEALYQEALKTQQPSASSLGVSEVISETVKAGQHKNILKFEDIKPGKVAFDRYDKLIPLVVNFARTYGGSKPEYQWLRELADVFEGFTISIGKPEKMPAPYANYERGNKKIVLDKDFVDFLFMTGRKKIAMAWLIDLAHHIKYSKPMDDEKTNLVCGSKKSLTSIEEKTRLDDTLYIYKIKEKIIKNDTPEGPEVPAVLTERNVLLVISDYLHRGRILDAPRLQRMLRREFGFYGNFSIEKLSELLEKFYEIHKDKMMRRPVTTKDDIENLKKKLAETANISLADIASKETKTIRYSFKREYMTDPAFKNRLTVWDVEVERQDEVDFGGKTAHTGELMFAPRAVTLENFATGSQGFQALINYNTTKIFTDNLRKNIEALRKLIDRETNVLDKFVDFLSMTTEELIHEVAKGNKAAEILMTELTMLRVILDEGKLTVRKQLEAVMEGYSIVLYDLEHYKYKVSGIRDYFNQLGKSLDDLVVNIKAKKLNVEKQIELSKARLDDLRKEEKIILESKPEDEFGRHGKEKKLAGKTKEIEGKIAEIKALESLEMHYQREFEEVTLKNANRFLYAARNLVVPPDLDKEIKDNLKLLAQRLGLPVEKLVLAIRSSAVGEDSEEASFAGRQDTYIFQTATPKNIAAEINKSGLLKIDEDGLDNFVTSWVFNQASLFNKRAIDYRFDKGLPTFDNHVEISTLFQRMFLSKYSFIAFSVDRGTAFPSMSMNIHEGQGEMLVSGQESGSKYVVSLDGQIVIVRDKGERNLKVVETEDRMGKRKIPLSANERNEFSVTDEELVKASAGYFASIDDFYDEGFVDLEGAYRPKEDGNLKSLPLKDAKGAILKDHRGFDRMDWNIVSTQARPETVYSLQDPSVIKLKKIVVTDAAFEKAERERKVMEFKFIARTEGTAQGEVSWVHDKTNPDELAKVKGKVMVARQSDPDMNSAMLSAKGIVAILGGQNSHTMIVASEYGLVAITGTTEQLTEYLKEGMEVTIDAERGKILLGYDHELKVAGRDFSAREIPDTAYGTARSSTIVASRDKAMFQHPLRNIPSYKGVGLKRMEIDLAFIETYTDALLAYDNMILQEKGGKAAEGKILDRKKDEQLIKFIEEKIKGFNSGRDFYETVIREGILATAEPLNPDDDEVRFRYQQIKNKELKLTVKDIVEQIYKEGLGHNSDRLLVSLKILYDAQTQGSLERKIIEEILGLLDKRLYVRLDDRKSDEYKNVKGAELFVIEELNAMKGYRGLSLLLGSPTLKWQLKVMIDVAKLHRHKIAIFAPIVRRPEDFKKLIEKFLEVGKELGISAEELSNLVEIGMMTEIPTNSVYMEDYLKVVQDFRDQGIPIRFFTSTGGNDGLQTIYRIDRNTGDAELKNNATAYGPAVIRWNSRIPSQQKKFNKEKIEAMKSAVQAKNRDAAYKYLTEIVEAGYCGNDPSVRGQEEYGRGLSALGYKSVSVVIEAYEKVAKNLAVADVKDLGATAVARYERFEKEKDFDFNINPAARPKVQDYIQVNIGDILLGLGVHYRLFADYDAGKLTDEKGQVLVDEVKKMLRAKGYSANEEGVGMKYFHDAVQEKLEEKFIEAQKSEKKLVIGTDDALTSNHIEDGEKFGGMRGLLGGERYESLEANPDYGFAGLVKNVTRDREFFARELAIIRGLKSAYPDVKAGISLRLVRTYTDINEALAVMKEAGLIKSISLFETPSKHGFRLALQVLEAAGLVKFPANGKDSIESALAVLEKRSMIRGENRNIFDKEMQELLEKMCIALKINPKKTDLNAIMAKLKETGFVGGVQQKGDISVGLDVQVTANLFEIKEILDPVRRIQFLSIPDAEEITGEMMALERNNVNNDLISPSDIRYQTKKPIQILATAAAERGISFTLPAEALVKTEFAQASSLGDSAVTLEVIKGLAEKRRWNVEFKNSQSQTDNKIRIEAVNISELGVDAVQSLRKKSSAGNLKPGLIVTLPQGREISGQEVMDAILSAIEVNRPYFASIRHALLRIKEVGLRTSEQEMDAYGASLGKKSAEKQNNSKKVGELILTTALGIPLVIGVGLGIGVYRVYKSGEFVALSFYEFFAKKFRSGGVKEVSRSQKADSKRADSGTASSLGERNTTVFGNYDHEKDLSKITNSHVRSWVREMANFTGAGKIEIVDASDDERLLEEEVAAGKLIKLPDGNFYTRSHPKDVARSEERTFVSTKDLNDKGLNNNWKHSDELKPVVKKLIEGSMTGKKMYIIPYLMGPVGSEFAQVGVEVTDSRYVALNMIRMTKVGKAALDHLGTSDQFLKGVHSTGNLEQIHKDIAESKIDNRYFASFPDDREIWSYGSAYGGNALLGKKFHSLRQAGYDARKEGWLAEHMAIVEIERLAGPNKGEKKYVAAAFPSVSGKTNFAMMKPPAALEKDYAVRVVGDDIAWLRIGKDGQLRAINPENGFFGVVPGTNYETNPAAMDSIRGGTKTLFTNVAINEATGELWWEGKSKNPPADIDGWKDWQGKYIKDRKPEDVRKPWAHPNSRFTTSATNAPNLSPAFSDRDGVPISAIFWGGRMENREPLIRQLHSSAEGIYDGLVMGVEATAAAEGTEGQFRPDPWAKKPFFAGPEAEDARNMLEIMTRLRGKAPKFFHVNWFRKGTDGRWLWPGYGENLRLVLWALDRAEGKGGAINTPIGFMPSKEDLNLEGLSISDADISELLRVDAEAWKKEAVRREEFLKTLDKNRLPLDILSVHNHFVHEISKASSLGANEAELVFPKPELVKKLVTDAQRPTTIFFHKDALQPGSPFVQLIFQLIQFTQQAGGFRTMSDAVQRGGIRLTIVVPDSKNAEQDVQTVINAIYLSSGGRVTLQREWFSVVTSIPYSKYTTFAIGPSTWLDRYKSDPKMKRLTIPASIGQPDRNAAALSSRSLASTGAVAFNSIAPLRFCKEISEIAKDSFGSSLGDEPSSALSAEALVDPMAVTAPVQIPYDPFKKLLEDYQVPAGFSPRKDNPMSRSGVKDAGGSHITDGRAQKAVQDRGILGRKSSPSGTRNLFVGRGKNVDGKRTDNILGLPTKTKPDRNILGKSLGSDWDAVAALLDQNLNFDSKNVPQGLKQPILVRFNTNYSAKKPDWLKIAVELRKYLKTIFFDRADSGENWNIKQLPQETKLGTATFVEVRRIKYLVGVRLPYEIKKLGGETSEEEMPPYKGASLGEGRALQDVVGTIKELAGRIIGNEAPDLREFLFNLVFGAELTASASEDESLKTFRGEHASYILTLLDGIYAKAHQEQPELGVLATTSDLYTPEIERQLKLNPKALAVIVFTGPLRDLNAFKQKFAGVSDRVIIEPASVPEAGSVMNNILTGSALRKLAGNVKQTELARHTSVFAAANILNDLKGLKLATRLVARHQAQLAEFNISPADFNLFANTVGFLIAKKGGYDALNEDIREGLSRPDGNNWVQFNLGLLGAKIAQLAQEFAGFQAVLKAA